MSPFDRLRLGPVLTALFASLGTLFRSRAALQLEILVLRHQLGVLQRSVKRPNLSPADRVLWAWLSSVWTGWESRVSIVKGLWCKNKISDDGQVPRFGSIEDLFKGRHFDQEIVVLCVRWYLSYKLSYRDLVAMMGERGICYGAHD